MDEFVKVSLQLLKQYRKNQDFLRSVPIEFSSVGAATYMSWVAYPSANQSNRRERFSQAMLSGAIREYGKLKRDICKRDRLMQALGVGSLLSWRDIDSAITGKGQKIGGGTRKIIDRFHSYHAFMSYDNALERQLSVSFYDVLSKISTVYESVGSSISDEETRLDHLKRDFREGRPVLHLTGGLIESHRSKGWCNECGQLNQGVKPAIFDWSWLNQAIDVSQLILGLQLLEYESESKNGKKLRRHAFNPSEVVDVYFGGDGSISGP